MKSTIAPLTHSNGRQVRPGKNGNSLAKSKTSAPEVLELRAQLEALKTEIAEATLKNTDFQGQIAAINKAQAVIEFNLDGTVITANDNFLNALGYTLSEIKGQHHSMFVEPAYRASVEYKQFWRDLNDGKFQAAEYKRLGKGGKEVWIQASYNPIFDLNGKPFKVVKYATDVTATKLQTADFQGQIAAVGKAQVQYGSGYFIRRCQCALGRLDLFRQVFFNMADSQVGHVVFQYGRSGQRRVTRVGARCILRRQQKCRGQNEQIQKTSCHVALKWFARRGK